jgi:hypothetical protein
VSRLRDTCRLSSCFFSSRWQLYGREGAGAAPLLAGARTLVRPSGLIGCREPGRWPISGPGLPREERTIDRDPLSTIHRVVSVIAGRRETLLWCDIRSNECAASPDACYLLGTGAAPAAHPDLCPARHLRQMRQYVC